MFTKNLWLLAVVAISAPAIAADKLSLKTGIFAVEAPTSSEKSFNILSTMDGRVYKIDANNSLAVSAAKLAATSHADVTIEMDSNKEFVHTVNVDFASITRNALAAEAARTSRVAAFKPTVLDSMRDAKALFSSVYSFENADLNDNCFNRAHYWARTLELEQDVKSQKVYVMFTEKYRRDNNYKWWYHVAPFVLVDDQEVVLDPAFLSRPYEINAWGSEFADHAANGCESTDSLNEYYSRGNEVDCFLIRASMYHYTPNDLYNIPSKTQWECSDLRGPINALPQPGKSWKKVMEEGFLPDYCN